MTGRGARRHRPRAAQLDPAEPLCPVEPEVLHTKGLRRAQAPPAEHAADRHPLARFPRSPAMPALTPAARLARHFAARLIRRALRRAFRRVVWAGPAPALPPAPVVLYANHHLFHDGYLLWLLVGHRLGRPVVVWMEEWARAPLFGPLGALPFPPDDPRARAVTIRETARRMSADPRTVLLLFPEGAQGRPDDGLAPFQADLPRLARLLPPETHWWPVALRATWWGEARPTALLTGGALAASPDGQEPDRLQGLLDLLTGAVPDALRAGHARLLLDGGPDAHERWDLSTLAPLFRRWS